MKKIENYIHGKSISHSKKFLPVFDPSSGELSYQMKILIH